MSARNVIVKLAAAAIAAAMFMSCCQSRVKARLSDIESFINERPDSALAALRAIDTLDLRTRAEKAKYSLLHAMALDKNYIDTADTRVIQPAIDFYDKRGSDDEKLKSYYYEGIALYYGKQYNKAILSFTKGQEYVLTAKDLKQCGMLYSCLADTYTKTWDYYQASDCIDKSIDFFRRCGNDDFVSLELYRKAQNLVNLKHWDKALSTFEELLSDTSITSSRRHRIEANYAMALITSPTPNDSLSLDLFSRAIKGNGVLENANQYGAYAYSLFSAGRQYEADSIFNYTLSLDGQTGLYYNYWKHRILLKKKDFKGAYSALWAASKQSDSLSKAISAASVLNAQKAYIESLSFEKSLKIMKKDNFIRAFLFILVLVTLVFFFIIWRKRVAIIEESNRMASIVDSLEKQIEEMGIDKRDNEEKLSRLALYKNKAKFSYLSEIFEIVYLSGNSDDEECLKRMYKRLKSKVKTLESDPSSSALFEQLLNNESDNIMSRFRNDFPGLSSVEYRMASLIFAGFDNTTTMLLLNTTSSNTRVMKNRLKNKIEHSLVKDKNAYLVFFHQNNLK